MFEFIHPSVDRGSTFTTDDLHHFTRDIHAPLEGLVQAHYQAVFKAILAKRKNPGQACGALFEQCIYDAICQAGVDPSWIQTGVDMADGRNAEVDFLISQPGHARRAVLAKVSLRERWKQADRDAMVVGFRHNDLQDNLSLVFLAEKQGDTIAQARRKAATTQGQCFVRLSILTATDHPAMLSWLQGLVQ